MARSPRNQNDRRTDFTVSGDGASDRARSILSALDLESPEQISIEITHSTEPETTPESENDDAFQDSSSNEERTRKLPREGTAARKAVRALASAPQTWLKPNSVNQLIEGGYEQSSISTALSRYAEKGTLDRRENGNGYEYRFSNDLCRQELLAEAEQEGEL